MGYQAKAAAAGVNPLGYVLAEVVRATNSLDQGKLARYMHGNTFDMGVGKVTFDKGGEHR